MPRENSFSDEGRSLTPDLELPDGAAALPSADRQPASLRHPTALSPTRPTVIVHRSPKDRFRAAVNKVIRLHRTSTIIRGHTGIGAEPGIDPRHQSAYLNYGHIRCGLFALFFVF
jgi:hypothetical protein